MSYFSRRVPLYIWLPIVFACAAAGFVASTLRQARGIPSPRSEAPNHAPVTASQSEALIGPFSNQLSPALGEPRDQLSVALVVPEADLPTAAIPARTNEWDAIVPKGKSVSPAPKVKHAATRAPPVRTGRSVARARRPPTTLQQPTKAVLTTSTSLKNVPIFGPVFAMFQ